MQVRTAEGQRQYDILILKIAQAFSLEPQLSDIARRLRDRPRDLIRELVRVFVNSLAQEHRESMLQHEDVVRALILLISDDLECASVAHAWLQGIELEPADARALGFRFVKKEPIEIVRGIAWAMSLIAPTMIAVDQIDAIVSESNARTQSDSNGGEEHKEAQSIIEALACGLIELHEVKRRSVTVIASLEATWNVLEKRATAAWSARYKNPDILQPLSHGKIGEALVGARLSQAYAGCGFEAPYETWPFSPEAFETAIGFSPRQLLKACEDHRLRCISEGRVTECRSFIGPPQPGNAAPPPKTSLDAIFNQEQRAAKIADLLEQEHEEQLRDLLTDALGLLAKQLDLPDDIDMEIRGDPDQRRPSLHGRLSFIFRSDGDRERHYCFRVLVHSNAIAFQSRLNAAMVASGVDRALSFRHLFILRPDDPPGGPKTKLLVQKFLQAGGKFIAPGEADLRAMGALRNMRHIDGFDAWLRTQKPFFDTALFKAAELCPPYFLLPKSEGGDLASSNSKKCTPSPPVGGSSQSPAKPTKEISTGSKPPLSSRQVQPAGGSDARPDVRERQIPIGRRYERGNLGGQETLPGNLLTRHVAIIAGSGSGKTVLLRRIVEEAALLDMPAIVLDTNNDLARLGDKWRDRPQGWAEDDVIKATEYLKRVEVVIWTPGRSSGNPIALGLLPDFSELADDPDARDQAVEMANATLAPWIGATGSSAALKRGSLRTRCADLPKEAAVSLMISSAC